MFDKTMARGEGTLNSNSLPAPAYFEAVIASARDAVVTCSLAGDVVSCNAAACHFFPDAGNIVGKNINEVLPSLSFFHLPPYLEPGNNSYDIISNKLITRQTNSAISLNISAIKDNFGSSIGYSYFIRKHKETLKGEGRSDQNIYEQQAMVLAAVVNSSDDAIVTKTPDGIVTSWNPAAEHIFGYKSTEIVGKHITALFPSERLAEENWLLNKLRQGERIRHFETERLHHSGRRISVSVTLSPICNPDGALIGISKIARDITDRVKKDKQIWHQAHHDPLTNLPNRRLLMRELAREIKTHEETNSLLGLMLFDLDGFKKINDMLGHDAGDQLLMATAIRVKQCLNTSDLLARLGGDEFVVLLPNLDSIDAATVVAKRILGELSRPFILNRQLMRISASIGVTGYPHYGLSVETLLADADRALYLAKDSGRNCFRLSQSTK